MCVDDEVSDDVDGSDDGHDSGIEMCDGIGSGCELQQDNDITVVRWHRSQCYNYYC